MQQTSEKAYRALVDSAVMPMIYYALDGRLLLLNQAGAVNLGISPHHVEGLSLYELLPDEASDIQIRNLSMAKSGIPHQFVDMLKLQTGTRWFHSTARPIRDALGESMAIQVISEDITEFKQADVLLLKLQSQLQRDRSKRHDFLAQDLNAEIEKHLCQLRSILKNAATRHTQEHVADIHNTAFSTDQVMADQPQDTPQHSLEILTPREKEVFQLTAEGCDRVEIAERLFISPRTAEAHRANAMRKLGIRTRLELLRFALQHGILSMED